MASYPYHEDPPSYISLFPDAVINTNTGIQVRVCLTVIWNNSVLALTLSEEIREFLLVRVIPREQSTALKMFVKTLETSQVRIINVASF